MWYEILIAILAIGIVALPIVLHFVNKKKGKSSCGCDCASCHKCDCCLKPENDTEDDNKNK